VAVLPEGIPAVPYGTFLECTKLEAVRIPMNVKTIEMHAFFKCTNLKNLVLPSSVTEIAKDAFARCTDLRLIAFSENVQSIGAGAFDGCQNLNQVYYGGTQAQWAQITIGERNSQLSAATVHFEQEMPYGSEEPDMMDFLTFSDKDEEVKLSQCVPTFGGSMLIPEEYEQTAVTSISSLAFRDCVYMDMVLIPDTVTMIGESAFKNCLSMVLAYAGEGTETIQASAFANCVNLGAIFLPANLQAIDKNAFLNCNGLEIVFYDGTQEQWEAISIADGNDALAQAEIMYEWSSMEEPEEYVDGYVTYIIENEEAIVYYCDEEAVGSIQIPAMVEDYPVTAIDEYAFVWCEGITSISFADTVAVIGESAFEGCEALTDVYYGGTQAQWEQIEIALGNDCLTNAKLHFEKEAPELIEPGDVDGVEGINVDDAIYLLQSVLMPELFPVAQPTDFNSDGQTNVDDAIYLLQHVLMPELFPLA
jgi:hypothetical protein